MLLRRLLELSFDGWKSNTRVRGAADLHAIEQGVATVDGRWPVASPLDGASAATSSPRNDLVKTSCRARPPSRPDLCGIFGRRHER